MARVVLVPTDRAAEHFDLDPITQEVAPAVMNTETESNLILPHIGQRISRHGVELQVISVSESADEDGEAVYHAVVDVTA